ncbi:hypothetical protein SmJEL517_g03544 [Synchytrium microbalum]|uniref:Protein SMG7 n=1 Tax=Synchytrium microbalum TaxID=1806994 RepID=A0A507BW21_9FUNG|nr:uncharacterized protein SmJEL517_g03544 [Synchytrium microbalum]TPX33570.1 hypothetical protein SmJEL517_g03544 [Synchytrium microbalum]
MNFFELSEQKKNLFSVKIKFLQTHITRRLSLSKILATVLEFYEGFQIMGQHQFKLTFPFFTCYQFAGVFTEVGPNQSNFKVGEQVFGSEGGGDVWAEQTREAYVDTLMMPVAKDSSTAHDLLLRQDKELRDISKTHPQFDPDVSLLRTRVRDGFADILIRHLDFAVDKDVDAILWKTVHYRVIEDFRKRIRLGLSGVDDKAAAKERKNDLKVLSASFHQFLMESAGFYLNLLRKLKTEYDLDIVEKLVLNRLGTEPNGADAARQKATISKNTVSAETQVRATLVCHRVLLQLGDITRYKEFYSDRKEKNYSTAKLFYRLAAQLAPAYGNPHNQLAVVESLEGNELGAVEHYLRSLLVAHPFSAARDNLLILLQKASGKRLPDGRSDYSKFVDLFLAFHGAVFSLDHKTPVNEAKGVVSNAFRENLVKKGTISSSILTQVFIVSIGCLYMASSADITMKMNLDNRMMAAVEELLSQMIQTISTLVAGKFVTTGSSTNSALSFAVAPPPTSPDALKQSAKYLPALKLVVKWLTVNDAALITRTAWTALADALNGLSAVTLNDSSDADVTKSTFLSEDVDFATFTPVNSDDDVMDGSKQNDLVDMVVSAAHSSRQSEDDENMIRAHQIIGLAKQLCREKQTIHHAIRSSPDGNEYDYFAITPSAGTTASISPTKSFGFTSKALLTRPEETSPARRDVQMMDAEDEDVDETAMWAPGPHRNNSNGTFIQQPVAAQQASTTFMPQSASGSNVQQLPPPHLQQSPWGNGGAQSASPHSMAQRSAYPSFQHPTRTSSPTNPMAPVFVPTTLAPQTDYFANMVRPNPIINSALTAAQNVTAKQASLNRNQYARDIEDMQSGDGRDGGNIQNSNSNNFNSNKSQGDVSEQEEAMMKWLGLMGSPPSRGGNKPKMTADEVKAASTRYDLLGSGMNQSRPPPGLSATVRPEISWSAFAPPQNLPGAGLGRGLSSWNNIGHQAAYRPSPSPSSASQPFSFGNGGDVFGRLPSTTAASQQPTTSEISWLNALPPANGNANGSGNGSVFGGGRGAGQQQHGGW